MVGGGTGDGRCSSGGGGNISLMTQYLILCLKLPTH